MATRIPISKVRRTYNGIGNVWDEDDYWHFHLFHSYGLIMSRLLPLFERKYVLNVGGGHELYGLSKETTVTVDIAEKQLSTSGLNVCGDAHYLPFPDEKFSSAIAIGSIVNYCSALEFFLEMRRVLYSGAYFLFDFEQLNSFENISSAKWRQNAHLFPTEIKGQEEYIWLYSHKFIKSLLKKIGFTILRTFHIHVLSSLVYRLTRDDRLTTVSCRYDNMFSRIPIARGFASTIVILCQKNS